MKLSVKGKGFSALVSLVGAIAGLVSAIAFLIYSGIYSQYGDYVVTILLFVGVVLSLVYAFVDGLAADYAPLGAAMCYSFALGLFFMNTFNVWEDWVGGANFFGSEGGLTWVVVLLVFMVVSALCEIIASFTLKKDSTGAKEVSAA